MSKRSPISHHSGLLDGHACAFGVSARRDRLRIAGRQRQLVRATRSAQCRERPTDPWPRWSGLAICFAGRRRCGLKSRCGRCGGRDLYELTAAIGPDSRRTAARTVGVTYEAAPGARPVFTGGRAITGFQPDEDGTVEGADPGGGRRVVVLRAVVRQWPPGHAGAQPEQVLLLHARRAGRGRSKRAAGSRPVRARQTVTAAA